MTEPSVRHRAIIRHPARAAVLLVAEAGALRLPSFMSEDRHTAEVDHINAAVHQRFGLVTTVLQSLRHDLDPRTGVVTRVHALAVHGDAVAPNGGRWCSADELASLAPDDAGVACEWLAAASPAPDGREWYEPGWFERARLWIAQSLRAAGVEHVDRLVQLRAWESSCVVRIDTSAGEFYFKAVAASAGRECAVAAYLAQYWPEAVPPLVACDRERRWLLMRGCRGPKLEDVADPSAWERAAAMYGRLQVACSARTADLRALGCPERSLTVLAAEIDPLLADVEARGGDAGTLSVTERAQLSARAPELRRRCAALGAEAIPSTLEHGDLWPGNFLLDGERWVLIDWEDAAVGHPFFSLAPLLVGLRTYQPGLDSAEIRQRLEAAYLSAFTAFGSPDRLRAALALAAPLAFLDLAIRYRRQPPSVVRLHPWMRDLTLQALRLALSSFREGEGCDHR